MKIKINLQEIKAAIHELEARTKNDTLDIIIDDNKMFLSEFDRCDNKIEVTLYDSGSKMAEFKYTERLTSMKDRKRL